MHGIYQARKYSQQARTKMKKKFFMMAILPMLYSSLVLSHDESVVLTSSDIIYLFSGKTLKTENQRSKIRYLTFLGKEGIVKQWIPAKKIKRKGRWHAAEDQLCIRWEEIEKEFCNKMIWTHHNVVYLVKDGKIQSVVNSYKAGNSTGF